MHPITLIALALPSIILLILVVWGSRTLDKLLNLEREHRELQKRLSTTRDLAFEFARWIVVAADHHGVDVANITLERARNLVAKKN